MTTPIAAWLGGVRTYTASPVFNSIIAKSVEENLLERPTAPTYFPDTGDELTTSSE